MNKLITWCLVILGVLLALVLSGRGDVAWFIVTLPFTIVFFILDFIGALFALVFMALVIYCVVYNLTHKTTKQ